MWEGVEASRGEIGCLGQPPGLRNDFPLDLQTNSTCLVQQDIIQDGQEQLFPKSVSDPCWQGELCLLPWQTRLEESLQARPQAQILPSHVHGFLQVLPRTDGKHLLPCRCWLVWRVQPAILTESLSENQAVGHVQLDETKTGNASMGRFWGAIHGRTSPRSDWCWGGDHRNSGWVGAPPGLSETGTVVEYGDGCWRGYSWGPQAGLSKIRKTAASGKLNGLGEKVVRKGGAARRKTCNLTEGNY